MIKVIGVRFRSAGKVYYFDPKGLDIKRGDSVIVETARGVEFGDVTMGLTDITDDRVTAPLKPVIRIATDEDRETVRKHKESSPGSLTSGAAFVLSWDVKRYRGR